MLTEAGRSGRWTKVVPPVSNAPPRSAGCSPVVGEIDGGTGEEPVEEGRGPSVLSEGEGCGSPGMDTRSPCGSQDTVWIGLNSEDPDACSPVTFPPQTSTRARFHRRPLKIVSISSRFYGSRSRDCNHFPRFGVRGKGNAGN